MTEKMITQESSRYQISKRVARWIFYSGIPFIAIYWYLLTFHFKPDVFRWMLNENHPVELTTVICFLCASFFAIRLAFASGKKRSRRKVSFLFSVLGVAFFVIAMEEIAWFQWLFKFETPDAINAVNAQGEMTLHNHKAVQETLEIFPLAAGALGLIGVWLSKFPFLRYMMPSRLLAGWFVAIFIFSLTDCILSFGNPYEDLNSAINRLQELIEWAIAACSMLFAWMSLRLYTLDHKP